MANDRQLVMDYSDFKHSLAEEVWPEVGDSYDTFFYNYSLAIKATIVLVQKVGIRFPLAF